MKWLLCLLLLAISIEAYTHTLEDDYNRFHHEEYVEMAPLEERSKILRRNSRIYFPVPVQDGAGVKLGRTIGSFRLENLDPFLLLDEFNSADPSAYIAGFPNHPHRGFETVTVMLEGYMEHKDNKGNQGLLGPGSVQWMTAGSGVVHSEMPKMENGKLHGFQLWLNLPSSHKMIPPRYQDINPEEFPTLDSECYHIRVIAGTYMGVTGPVKDVVTQPLMLDITLNANCQLDLDTSYHETFIAYLYEGNCYVSEDLETPSPALLTFFKGDYLRLKSHETTHGKYLVVGAMPIGEPIVRRGPFVMNTIEELAKAESDYRNGKF